MSSQSEDDQLRAVAAEIMRSAGFCALVTVDGEGAPQARAMDPFDPEDDLVVWMGTNARTRKVQELRDDPRATLYYHDVAAGAYVALRGRGFIVDDPAEKARRWKPEWHDFYDDDHRGADYVLVRFVPDVAEIISMKHGVATDPKGFAPAVLELR
jgi:general stress protein 26